MTISAELFYAIIAVAAVLLIALIYVARSKARVQESLGGMEKKLAETQQAVETAQADAAAAKAALPKYAAGSCGDIRLFTVPDRIAAMAMALVADQIGAPLNELRFISIKEVD